MDKSTHKCEVVVVHPKPHPNADKLEVVEVYGYSVCVRKGEFKDGDLGIYIPPDSIVPEIEQFKFVWEMKGYVSPPQSFGGGPPTVPERYRRIKAKVLRGVVSEGLLMPVTAFPDSCVHNGEVVVLEEEDLAEELDITHYDPPDFASLRGDCESAPIRKTKKRRFPRSFMGWVHLIAAKLGLRPQGMNNGDQQETVGFQIPNYDLDAWQRYKHLLEPNELVWITEKIHGANCRFVYMPGQSEGEGRMYVGSHYQWKRDVPGSAFWAALRQNPWISQFCREYPGWVLYGELVPTQKLDYGQPKGQYRVFGFDILDPIQKGPNQPQGKWLSYDELKGLGFNVVYMEGEQLVARDLLDGVHWVPTIALVAYDETTIRQYASGQSMVERANHIREGIVIRPCIERHDPRFGRVVLKLKSPEYLASKHSDE